MSHDEKIDLKNLSQKELLILLNEKVEKLEEDTKARSNQDVNLLLRVNALEIKLQLWAVLGASLVTIIFKVVEKLL